LSTAAELLKYKKLIFDENQEKLIESVSKNKGRNLKTNSLLEISSTNDPINKSQVTKHMKNKSFDLYERSRDIQLQKKIDFEENEKIKSQKEIEGCTFQPIVNKNFHSRNSLKIYRIDHEKREIDFNDRNTVWSYKRSEK
jgi:hypothetical protein